MAHWHRVLPAGRILDVRYEDVVADLEGAARRIIAHCGLDWDARCLDFHRPSGRCAPPAPRRCASRSTPARSAAPASTRHLGPVAEALGIPDNELSQQRAHEGASCRELPGNIPVLEPEGFPVKTSTLSLASARYCWRACRQQGMVLLSSAVNISSGEVAFLDVRGITVRYRGGIGRLSDDQHRGLGHRVGFRLPGYGPDATTTSGLLGGTITTGSGDQQRQHRQYLPQAPPHRPGQFAGPCPERRQRRRRHRQLGLHRGDRRHRQRSRDQLRHRRGDQLPGGVIQGSTSNSYGDGLLILV